jgi:hypothetical protein
MPQAKAQSLPSAAEDSTVIGSRHGEKTLQGDKALEVV